MVMNPSPFRFECVGWETEVDGASLHNKPGLAAIARQLWVTLACAVIMGFLAYHFGLPPGSKRVSVQQAVVAKAEQQLEDASKRFDRIRTSTSGPNSAVNQGAKKLVDAAKQQVDYQKQRLDCQKPTLGATADRVFWGVMILLGVIGVGLPIYACFVRVHFVYDGPPGRGTLRIVTQPIGRTRRYDVAHFNTLAIQVKRIVTSPRDHQRVIDHGWLWTIELTPARAGTQGFHDLGAVLIIQPLMEPNLPARVADLTDEVRLWVRYLEAITRLQHEPPVTDDVIHVQRGLWGSSLKRSIRRHEKSI